MHLIGFFRHVDGRRLGIVAGGAALVLLVVTGGIAYATHDYTQRYAGRILPGARVAGVNVGGMTYAQALEVVTTRVSPQLDRIVTLTHGDKKWEVTPRELGARSSAEEAVEAALRASREASTLSKVKMTLLGDDLDFTRDVAITYPRQGVRGFVRGIASSFDRAARDASIDYSTGWVEIAPDRTGREVLERPTRRALQKALRTQAASAQVTVRRVAPDVTAEEFDQILLLRIGENKLYLYDDGKIVREWVVATGQPEYPTPTGIYEITLKRYMPTWVNPDPDGWGASMPASIPPGPGNPLGVRALNWSAPAIRFHGTSATYSLGYNASHGCVRMANEDAIELYDLVEVGVPIVSVQVAPLKPLYAAAPDPIVVPDDRDRTTDTLPTRGGGDRDERE